MMRSGKYVGGAHTHGSPPPRASSSGEDNDTHKADKGGSADNDLGDEEGALLLPPDRLRKDGGGDRDDVDWSATGFAFVFPAFGGLLFGWDIGSTSGALTSVMDPATSGTDWYSLTPFQQGLVVSLSLAGALVASAAAALKLGDKLGAKKELMLASLFYSVGAVTQGLAPTLQVLMLGRFLYGLGIGFAMHAAPMYIAETSPPSVRGLLISLKECFIVGGILLGYLGSFVIGGHEEGWRTLLSSSAVLAVVLGLGMTRLPDSPRWLLQQGRPLAEARDALVRVRGTKAGMEVIEAEVVAMSVASEKAGSGGVMELTRRENRRPLYIGLSIVLFQQITGQPSVLYYAEQVFTAAGYDQSDSAGVAVILGGFKLLMTLFAVRYVDTVGRRPLLLGGVTVMTLSTITLGLCSTALNMGGDIGGGGDIDGTTLPARLSVAAIFTYVGAYQVSFGPIAWLLVGEIFPQRVRSAAIGTATLTNFLSNFLVSLSLPSIISTFGTAGTYYFFSTMGVVALSSIYLTVVETKGKTLEEIEAIMTDQKDRS